MHKIILRFDGEALESHSMDLDLLAESLGGLSTLIKEVHESINGTNDDLKVEVQGGFEEGSFEFILSVIETTDISTLAAIGFGAPVLSGGLVGAIKWLNGEKIERIANLVDGNCIIEKDDGSSLTVDGYIKNAVISPTVRSAFKKLVQKPLNKEGIDLFQVLNPDSEERSVVVDIVKEESRSFRAHQYPVNKPEIDDEIFDDIRVTFLTVHKDKQKHWRIRYDDSEIAVTMQDRIFMGLVQGGEGEAVFDNAYRVKLVGQYKKNSTIDKNWFIETVYGNAKTVN